MRDVRQYWREIRALAASLPEFVWLAGADGQAAFVTQVPAETAARLLHAKSHRLATPEEVEAHLACEAERERQARAEERRRKGTVLMKI
jgi:hypothetical protein